MSLPELTFITFTSSENLPYYWRTITKGLKLKTTLYTIKAMNDK